MSNNQGYPTSDIQLGDIAQLDSHILLVVVVVAVLVLIGVLYITLQ